MRSAQLEEATEAVIITGRRRGEIIQLSNALTEQTDSPQWAQLNDGLDALNEKLLSVSLQVRRATQALRPDSKGK